MLEMEQSPVIEFLSLPKSYGSRCESVKKIETHISVIFLAGARAYKLKRAVNYPYLDFSTLDLRRSSCEAEIAVNRRTAPSLYQDVIPVTLTKGGDFELGGKGEVVEWLVQMSRFDEETLFDRLAVAGRLDRHLMGDLAQSIADFHMAAKICLNIDSRKDIESTIASNIASFNEFGKGVFDSGEFEFLCTSQLKFLENVFAERATARQKAGMVRQCHGDLHLGNICLIDGNPTLFDAIEFNNTFTNIDVFYDLAFLLMDLDHRGHRRLANIVLNRYLDATADTNGLLSLPLFLSMRATVRAHVGATAFAHQSNNAEKEHQKTEARHYLERATNYLVSTPPRLVAVGGLSGSGKSRMGRDLAPYVGNAPGARIARSDVLRKRLVGIDPLTRLKPEGYSPEMTQRTYEALYSESRSALAQGHSVIADAVFARPEERKAIEGVARDMKVPFQGLWLEAPLEVMESRVTRRKNNPSDADASVVRLQQSYDLGEMTWTRIDSSGRKSKTLEKGLNLLGLSVVTDGWKGA